MNQLTLAAGQSITHDARGSVIAVSNASGTVIETYRYGPEPVPDLIGERDQQPHRFPLPVHGADHHPRGRRVSLQGAGLFPVLGRFLQTDPAGYRDGLNLYAYAGNDPINRIDPTGMLEEIVVTAPRLGFPWWTPYVIDFGNIGFDFSLPWPWRVQPAPEPQPESEPETEDEEEGEEPVEEVIITGRRTNPFDSGIFRIGFASSSRSPRFLAKPDHCGSPTNGTEGVPDRPLGNDFSQACANHDTCYATCGTSKSSCDSAFLGDMMSACTGDPVGRTLGNPVCALLAGVYFGGARSPLGQYAYRQAQQNACAAPSR